MACSLTAADKTAIRFRILKLRIMVRLGNKLDRDELKFLMRWGALADKWKLEDQNVRENFG